MSPRYSRAYFFLILGLVWMFSGCGFTITQPPNGGVTTSPVTIIVTWNTSSMSDIHFTIDGVDQTPRRLCQSEGHGKHPI